MRWDLAPLAPGSDVGGPRAWEIECPRVPLGFVVFVWVWRRGGQLAAASGGRVGHLGWVCAFLLCHRGTVAGWAPMGVASWCVWSSRGWCAVWLSR